MKNPFGDKQPNPAGLLNADGLATSQYAALPIQVRRWIRNGKHPNAVLESMKAEAGNQAALFRTKEVFRSFGYLGVLPSGGAGDRPHWRWAWHSGPYTRNLMVVTSIKPPDSGSTRSGAVRLDVTDPSSTTTSATMSYGRYGGDATWTAFQTQQTMISILPDTDYTGVLVEVDDAVIQSACVYELTSLTEWFGGYLPQNVTGGGPILDLSRQNQATLANALWRRGGAQLLAISTDAADGLVTRAGGGGWANVYDASTTPGPNTPGHLITTIGKARSSQLSTGVPVAMRAYCWNTAAPSSGGGQIAIVDQGGNAMLSLQTSATAQGWTSVVTGALPVGAGKYDVMLKPDATTQFNFWALSLYEYEP